MSLTSRRARWASVIGLVVACSSTSKNTTTPIDGGGGASGSSPDGGGRSGSSGSTGSSSGGTAGGGAAGSSAGGTAGSGGGGTAGSAGTAGAGGTAGAAGTGGSAGSTGGTAGCGNTNTDPQNCGACGAQCLTGERCFEGVCRGNDVVKVVASSLPCVLTKAGTVHCWGTNQYGQVGAPVSGNEQCGQWTCRSKPTRVEALAKAKDVAAGLDFACAVTTAGKVFCWGRNEFGQLGHNPASDDSCGEPCSARPIEVAGISNAKGVAAGRHNACAWTEAGALYCWGRNSEGVVGNGQLIGPVYTATPVTGLGSGVAKAALNLSANNHACAITGAGAVWCWGSNQFTQLGHAATIDMDCGSFLCNPTPRAVAGINDALDVFTVDGVSCVLRSDHTVWCWGFEGNGHFGAFNGTGPNPRQVTQLQRILGGSGFRLHFCARDMLSDTWCWGSNDQGQLGDGTTAGGYSGQTCTCKPPASVPNMKVRMVAAGDEFTLAVKLDGTVWAWGFNPDGRIGHMPGTAGDLTCRGNTRCNPVPSQISGLP